MDLLDNGTVITAVISSVVAIVSEVLQLKIFKSNGVIGLIGNILRGILKKK